MKSINGFEIRDDEKVREDCLECGESEQQIADAIVGENLKRALAEVVEACQLEWAKKNGVELPLSDYEYGAEGYKDTPRYRWGVIMEIALEA